jgi:hypothetical protein
MELVKELAFAVFSWPTVFFAFSVIAVVLMVAVIAMAMMG